MFSNDKQNYSETENLLNDLCKQLNTDATGIKNAIKNGNVKNLLKNLDSDTSKKLHTILSDKTATQKIISSPKAQLLLKKFLEEN